MYRIREFFGDLNPIAVKVVSGILALGIGVFIGLQLLDDGEEEVVQVQPTEQQQQQQPHQNVGGQGVIIPTEEENEDTAKIELTPQITEGLSEETLAVLEKQETHTEEEVGQAYQEGITTFNQDFVEDNILQTRPTENDGLYIYYEKGYEELETIAILAEELALEGASIYFYTPHNDQTLADMSNAQIATMDSDGNVVTYGVVVENGEVTQKYGTAYEVREYLGGM